MEDETEEQSTPTSVGKGLARFADPAMFEAAPMAKGEGGSVGMGAQVHLLWMTPDPLGSIAAMCRMYEGKPTYSLSDIEDSERERYWNDALSTHLKAPLEAVKFHFFLEAVDRSFTHQMVRQRTAVFAQESLRFAVKANLATESIRPPAVVQGGDAIEGVWTRALDEAQAAYDRLIALGVPAEDARGLLPHCVATRLNYVTDLRALADHAGNRLCTQAQFHWRYAFAGIVQAIRVFTLDLEWGNSQFSSCTSSSLRTCWENNQRWQFEMIADSLLFRPVCYQLGKCPFKATFDRHCSIRERVDANAAVGRPSSEWNTYHDALIHETHGFDIPPIREEEWLLNPSAAIKR